MIINNHIPLIIIIFPMIAALFIALLRNKYVISFSKLNQTNDFKSEEKLAYTNVGEYDYIRKNRFDHLKFGTGIRLQTLIISIFIFLLSVFLYTQISQDAIYYNIGSFADDIGIVLKADKNSSLLIMAFSLLFVLSLLFKNENISECSTYHSLLLFNLSGIIGILISNDIFNIYVFLEISSISSYILCASRKDKNSKLSSFSYLIYGSIGSSFILLAIGIIYMHYGSLNLSVIESLTEHSSHSIDLAFIFATLGIMLKCAIIPPVNWLIDLYKNMTNDFLVFFAATSSKISMMILLKFTESFEVSQPIVNLISIVTITISIIYSFIATKKNEVLPVITYSTISYNALIIAFINQIDYNCLIWFIIIDAYCKFSIMAMKNYIEKMNSEIFRVFIINSFMFLGMPFTANFSLKISIISQLIAKNNYYLLISFITLNILSIMYFFKIENSKVMNRKSKIKIAELYPITICNIFMIFAFYTLN